MALTLQKKLELAGDLAKVQPLLQRLHILQKPKKRHRLRNVLLVGSAIGACSVIAVVVRCRRGGHNGAVAGNGAYEPASSQIKETPPAESG